MARSHSRRLLGFVDKDGAKQEGEVSGGGEGNGVE